MSVRESLPFSLSCSLFHISEVLSLLSFKSQPYAKSGSPNFFEVCIPFSEMLSSYYILIVVGVSRWCNKYFCLINYVQGSVSEADTYLGSFGRREPYVGERNTGISKNDL